MPASITQLIFTRNRPMQLHGALEGLRRFFSPERIQTVILYKPELFDAEYAHCFSSFPGCRVIGETDFHADLLHAIEHVTTEYLLFGIDDVVYFDGVDLDLIEKMFERVGPDLLGFSLRLDPRQVPEDIAAGNVTESRAGDQTVYTLDWTKGQTKTTRYPFELCATVYRTADVKRIIAGTMKGGRLMHAHLAPSSFLTRLISCVYPRRAFLKKLGYFYNPNTFESWCCRHVQKHAGLFGRLLAFQKICASAIQVNMVNTSTANEWDDAQHLTVEALNKLYRDGARIDIDALVRDKPAQTHSEREYLKIKTLSSGDACRV